LKWDLRQQRLTALRVKTLVRAVKGNIRREYWEPEFRTQSRKEGDCGFISDNRNQMNAE
jgi:hypothetical protein